MEVTKNSLFQNPLKPFQTHLKHYVTPPSLQKMEGMFSEGQDVVVALKEQLQKYAQVTDFKTIVQQLEGQALFNEIVCEDVTFPYAVASSIRQRLSSEESAPPQEQFKNYQNSLALLWINVENYYGLKTNAKFKYHLLVNALYLQGKETLEQFQQKIEDASDKKEISFPQKIQNSLEAIQATFPAPSSPPLNTEQYLNHLKCLLATRKVFIDYVLQFFNVLQKLDTKTGNERVGKHCVERILLLFVPFFKSIQQQIDALKTIHRQKLETHCEVEQEEALQLWFDMLDIHFEPDPQIRQLKLYVAALGKNKIATWAAQQNLEDFPQTLKDIARVNKAPLDYQGVHQLAKQAYQKNPVMHQKIKEGMKIIETMQNRFQNYVKSFQTKKKTDLPPNKNDIYDFFYTLQEAREGSSFIRDESKTLLPRNHNQTPEMKNFSQFSSYKKEKFLEMLIHAFQNRNYVRSIAWQLHYWEEGALFKNFIQFLLPRKNQSAVLGQVLKSFSEILHSPEFILKSKQNKEAQKEQRKQEKFEKKLSQLKTVKARYKEGEIISEHYAKQKMAKRLMAERDEQYSNAKQLTADEVSDYLKDRRAKYGAHLRTLFEKRKSMTPEQQEVSKSTERFVEAQITMQTNLVVQDASDAGMKELDIPKVDQFEQETLKALQEYNTSCTAPGKYKKTYFENRENEIKGMLQDLRKQLEEKTLEGEEAARLMDSVHYVMGKVEENMQDLAGQLPHDAQEKLKELLTTEEKEFKALMEKKFIIKVRGSKNEYQLKSFVILPIPAKQKLLALNHFTYQDSSEPTEKENRALENFLYRSSFATSSPVDILSKDGSVQLIKLSNQLWYESLLYQKISLDLGGNTETMTLLDLFSLPLKPEGSALFHQHAQLMEKVLTESGTNQFDAEYREKIIRDVKNKGFENCVKNRYQPHSTTYDLFPQGKFDSNTFAEVLQWYRLRKEDQSLKQAATQ